MRKNRLLKNTVASFVFQITSICCGFILPRLILFYYGSGVNGLVNSITQFMQLIAALELGVGAVVQSALYKPLSQQDSDTISKIISSANSFFSKISKILAVYVVLLILIYPLLVADRFRYIYTASLILAMAVSFFSQYYFDIVDRLLLTADQKGYIHYIAQTATLIINTLSCILLIRHNASIQAVKAATSLIFLIRPILLKIYVNKNYNINKKIHYDEEPIKQKWNGIAQHIAAVVLESTDSVVLTIFSTLENVSIYSAYHLVMVGVKQLLLSITNGFQSLLGELWAKNEVDNLKDFFMWTEWFFHFTTTFVFTCVGLLILPFISVYTNGINDAEYIHPTFAILLTCANAGHCYRLPYNILILAAGHYRQTQHNYIIAMFVNIVVSIFAVNFWGLIGVAIGTLVAMVYQTFWMAYYDFHNLISLPTSHFYKQLFVDFLSIFIAVLFCRSFSLPSISYGSWAVLSIKTAFTVGIICVVVNLLFYKDNFKLIGKVI